MPEPNQTDQTSLDALLEGASTDTRNVVRAYALWLARWCDHPFIFKDGISERDLAHVTSVMTFLRDTVLRDRH